MKHFINYYLSRLWFITSGTLVLWGFWLAFIARDGLTIRALAALSELHIWGIFFVVSGAIGLLSGIGKRKRDKYALDIFELSGSVLVTACWFFIFIFYLIANPTTPSTFIYFELFIGSILNFLNVSHLYYWRNAP